MILTPTDSKLYSQTKEIICRDKIKSFWDTKYLLHSVYQQGYTCIINPRLFRCKIFKSRYNKLWNFIIIVALLLHQLWFWPIREQWVACGCVTVRPFNFTSHILLWRLHPLGVYYVIIKGLWLLLASAFTSRLFDQLRSLRSKAIIFTSSFLHSA